MPLIGSRASPSSGKAAPPVPDANIRFSYGPESHIWEEYRKFGVPRWFVDGGSRAEAIDWIEMVAKPRIKSFGLTAVVVEEPPAIRRIFFRESIFERRIESFRIKKPWSYFIFYFRKKSRFTCHVNLFFSKERLKGDMDPGLRLSPMPNQSYSIDDLEYGICSDRSYRGSLTIPQRCSVFIKKYWSSTFNDELPEQIEKRFNSFAVDVLRGMEKREVLSWRDRGHSTIRRAVLRCALGVIQECR